MADRNEINVHTEGASAYRLLSAILIYANRDHARANMYATLHQIEHRAKGGPVLGAGIPATKEGCAEFASAMAEQSAFAGFLSPELLYVAPRIVAWWRPPTKARVWFATEDIKDPKKHMGTRSAITPHPGLVFVLADDRWYVYAVKKSDRPGPETPLWRAPYFNVWQSGHICEGNLERPKRVTPATIASFERAFFDSRFTHPNDSGQTRHKGGIYQLWRELLDGKHREFPGASLVPIAKLTLAQCVRKHEENKHGE